MVRGWLEPGLLVLICCHAGALLTQGAAGAAKAVVVQLRPSDHCCQHCGVANSVEFEDIFYTCDICLGENNRLADFVGWDAPAPSPPPSMSHDVAGTMDTMAMTGL